MWKIIPMPEERTISIPSLRIYEYEQPDAFRILLDTAQDFARAKVFLYNLRYDVKYLGAEKGNETALLKEWSRAALGYTLPDYYITSVENKVSGILRAQDALFRQQQDVFLQEMETRKAKAAAMEKRLGILIGIKKELVSASKAGRLPEICPVYRKRYDRMARPDGSLPASEQERAYLFECSIDRTIRRTQAGIHQVRCRIRRAEATRRDIPSRMTFGSKAWYRSKDTNDVPHDAWRREWEDRRLSGLYFAGRHTSSDCNFLVKYLPASGEMILRIPDRTNGLLIPVILHDVRFPYHGELLINAIMRSRKERGSVSYDLLLRRDHFGRRYFLVRACLKVSAKLDRSVEDGIVAVDCNVDNLAVADLDREGHRIRSFTIPFDTDGVPSGRADDIIGRAVSRAVRYAEEVHKPIAMEDLDLKKLRASAAYRPKKLNRRTALFSYRKITAHMEGICFKRGVGLYKADPAYTSFIGKAKYLMRSKGPVHESAAFVIGRRALGMKERVPAYLRPLLSGKAAQGTYTSRWKRLFTKLKSVPEQMFRMKHTALTKKELTAWKKPEPYPDF